jgi:hypothetical protein
VKALEARAERETTTDRQYIGARNERHMRMRRVGTMLKLGRARQRAARRATLRAAVLSAPVAVRRADVRHRQQ